MQFSNEVNTAMRNLLNFTETLTQIMHGDVTHSECRNYALGKSEIAERRSSALRLINFIIIVVVIVIIIIIKLYLIRNVNYYKMNRRRKYTVGH